MMQQEPAKLSASGHEVSEEAQQGMDLWYLAQQLEAQGRQDVQATTQLIQIYEQLAGKLQPDENPIVYASIQNNLGNAYADLPVGDRTVNLERAIACYREALRFRTLETAPFNYAVTQNNLGNAYAAQTAGDDTTNLIQAIACYQEALHVWTPETAPAEYAAAQNNVGLIYYQMPIGNREEHLTRAIAYYNEALHFRTLEKTPLDYATTQNNLGNAYSDLPLGNRTTNLKRAIACYGEALRVWTPAIAPLDYAMVQNNLATAYCELPTGERGDNLLKAITCYGEALRVWTPAAAPLDYAMVQNNLATAYCELPTGDRISNLRQAIICYQEALRFRTPEAVPQDYATTQNNLGNAYSDLPTDNRDLTLQQAIACYLQALRVWTPETSPFEYAAAQSNLGSAYRQLPTGDRSAHLQQAIVCYQEALSVWTAETAPFEYATLQNNLGSVYGDLETGDRGRNLRQAIACYQEALNILTVSTAPQEYALIQNNMGLALYDLPIGDREENTIKAIECYQEALLVWTQDTDPFNHAMAQNNLGNAYSNLLTGNRRNNLRQAVACYQQALKIWTPETAPFDYAMAQNNLGTTYYDLSTREQDSEREEAKTCYQKALRIWTPDTAPSECRMASRNLAHLNFMRGNWKDALDAYRTALEAGEQLYRAGLSAESKSTEVAKNVTLHHHAAFAAVRCGEGTEALLILERGKTRLLAEALRLRVPRPAHVPDEVWNAFEGAGATVRAAQSERTVMLSGERHRVPSYETRAQAARDAEAALKVAIERVRVYDPEFLRDIDFAAMQALLSDEHTILVAFCITDQGSMGFIVSRNHNQGVRVIEVPDFARTQLLDLIGNWVGASHHFQIEHTQMAFIEWQKTMANTLAEVGRRLLTPILSNLSDKIERITFLPSAELFLLPLHAAPLSDNGPTLVCDRYQVSYAPSIEVLADIRTEAVQRATPGMPNLYAVVNPTADLVLALVEGTAIARLFAAYRTDEGPTGTKRHVIDGVQERSYVHFACHGSYDWDDPPESGLTLADGRLTLAELQRGEINLSSARLITLSACETGIVDVMRGSPEEYVGVPASFLLAGVPCVVSSLWAVPDLSTALLMEQFYRNHLQGQMNIAAALHEAQIWVRKSSVREVAQYAERCYQQSRQEERSELFKLKRYYQYQAEHNPTFRPFEHPYYWAAFTVNGM